MADGVGPTPVDTNSHIKEFLAYYFGLQQPPYYAVMLKGAWGAGKTFLVKEIIEDFNRKEVHHCYVSLFGLSSSDEIDLAVLSYLYPAAYSKGGRFVGHAIRAGLKFLKVDTDLDPAKFLDKFSSDIYIFDDLERCGMSVQETLGHINTFVEHDGCKVVILSNEDEIGKEQYKEYIRRKEKIVGRTLEVKPAFDRALAYFLSQVANPRSRAFFEAHAAEIKTVYEEAGLGNLRLLQQTLWDFDRLARNISDASFGRREGMAKLLSFYFALSFEFKAGRLGEQELRNRPSQVVQMMLERRNAEKTRFSEAQSRYSVADLSSPLLSDEVLVDALSRGIYSERIQACLEQDTAFAEAASIPAWKVVWHRDTLSEAEVATAVDRMEGEFAARQFLDMGEILHVFGLRLALSRDQVLTLSRYQVSEQCKAYVDDIYQRGVLKPMRKGENVFHSMGHAGLGFCDEETHEFRELFGYLADRAGDSHDDALPARATALIAEMKDDVALFWRRINYSNSPDSTFADVPIFDAMDLDEFLEAFWAKDNEDQRSILMAIKARYDHDGFARRFQSERPWVEALRWRLLDQADRSAAIERSRIRRSVRWLLQPVLT